MAQCNVCNGTKMEEIYDMPGPMGSPYMKMHQITCRCCGGTGLIVEPVAKEDDTETPVFRRKLRKPVEPAELKKVE